LIRLSSATAFALCCASLPAIAPAQVRIATWNTDTAFNSGGTPSPGTQTVLTGLGSESFNGIAKRVDILCLQEQNNTSGTTTAQIVNMMNGVHGPGTYARGSLVSGATSTPNTDSSAVVYDATRFQLINEVAVGTPSTSGMPRQEIRYQFRPVGYGAGSDFYVYVGHWKAQGTTQDMQRRNVEAQTLRANANTLPANSRILYVGDFNLTDGTSEAAWATMTAPGNGQGIDPKNGSWVNANQTWSTDGLGSRLDFQMNTPPTMDGRGFSYITNSYRTFGNNGTTPQNAPANTASNTALGSLPNRTAVLSALTTASAHYPVVAEYRYPARMGVSVAPVPNRVITGADVGVNVTVTNTAPVTLAVGADGLDYTLSGTGSLLGSGGASMLPALAPGNVHTLQLDTSSPGLRSGTLNVTGLSQEVGNGTFAQNVSAVVLAHSDASFAPSSNTDALTIDFGIRPRGGGTASSGFAVFNLAHASGFTAAMDLDSVAASGDVARLGANVATFSNLAPGGSHSFSATLDTSAVGSLSTSYMLAVSDEDIPGAALGTSLTLSLLARVAIGGDATLDDTVNLADFNILAANFGSTSATWQTGDFTLDALVNLADFNVLAANFGMSASGPGVTPEDWSALASAVPEPSLGALTLLAAPLLRRRRRCASASAAL
jgi:endonuclease/exonuclease/phosphatase family metal-dependent hydrolase